MLRARTRGPVRRGRALGRGFAVASLVALATACSVGDGRGFVRGTLSVPECWDGAFDLSPDFFAALPFRNTLQIRMQNGGDFQTFSDGVVILVNDLRGVRGDGELPGRLNQDLSVDLPPEVTPPGVPIIARPDPALVHLTVYLQRSCRTQNAALYAVSQVALGPDGECSAGVFAGDDPRRCDLSASAPPAGDPANPGVPAPPATPSGPVGTSTVRFESLFSGNTSASDAAERRTKGSFRVFLADPRDVCPGGIGPLPRCRGELTGEFDFFFQRGRPAQPFP
jgi:hypothetical protein